MENADTITWIKPNGKELETNALPATIEYCANLGFRPLGAQVESEFADMKAADLDAYAEDNDVTVPTNWHNAANGQKKMTVGEKRDYLADLKENVSE